MIEEHEYCYKVIEKIFNKPLVMKKIMPLTEKDNEDFKNSTKCWIFKKYIKKL